MLPSFLIVGVMKGGTSSLAAMLRQHPNIHIPEREVHFFNVEERYNLGLNHYMTYFSGWERESAVGEKTPTYSYHKEVPERIHDLLPDVKIIWIFREPVARAYSHYWFFVSMGKERLTFEDALKREARGETTDFTMRYRDRSIYASQVKRYLKFFSKKQMLFLKFDDLLKDHQSVLYQVCCFLEVNAEFSFPEQLSRKNITKIPKSIPLQWLAYKLFHKEGARILRLMKKINRKRVSGYPSMSKNTRCELQSFFEPYNAQLAETTGLDLSNWE